jgi:hypothetical protein
MGRPPIGKRAMSATERQRRWRKRRRLGRAGRPPDERAAAPEPPLDLGLIEHLRKERDQARQDLELALHDVRPGTSGPDDPGRCFYCLRRQDEVKVMLKASRPRYTVFTCDACVDRLYAEKAARLVGEARMESPG